MWPLSLGHRCDIDRSSSVRAGSYRCGALSSVADRNGGVARCIVDYLIVVDPRSCSSTDSRLTGRRPANYGRRFVCTVGEVRGTRQV